MIGVNWFVCFVFFFIKAKFIVSINTHPTDKESYKYYDEVKDHGVARAEKRKGYHYH